MRKVLSFSGFLMLGLVVSQFLPMMAGDGYGAVKSISNVLLYVCLSFIMINVGREFVLDKTRWKSYAQDYFIAMATAALPWFMIAIYYVFVLLPPDFLEQLGSLEGEFAVEPFCRTDISRYFVYDVGGYRAKVQLDL